MIGARESLPRGARRTAHPREPHPQHVLPAERGGAAEHPAPRRHEGAHRHADPGDHRAHRDRAARRRHAAARAAGAARAAASASTVSIPAWCCSTTISRRASPRSWRTSSNRSCRRCMPAGPRGCKSNHFAAYREGRRGVRQGDRHRPLAGESVFRCLRADPTSRSARARIVLPATWNGPRPGTQQIRANTRSTWSPSSSSRPTPAPTAWAIMTREGARPTCATSTASSATRWRW